MHVGGDGSSVPPRPDEGRRRWPRSLQACHSALVFLRLREWGGEATNALPVEVGGFGSRRRCSEPVGEVERCTEV
ncbi:UNVERIFIED_CONTAM: hypothetical protein GTU68_011801 [Idotea baltica]|nr:hypothetical protein [Idotea baltica]